MDIENKEEQQVEESGYEDVCFVCHSFIIGSNETILHFTFDSCRISDFSTDSAKEDDGFQFGV